MRIGLIGATLCLCLVGISHAQSAKAAIRKDLNVPAEELGSALQTVAKDYDFQVLYRTEIVKDLRTQGAVGTLTSDEALGKVLKGTGLTYKYLDANTVTIYPTSASSSNPQPAPAGSADTTTGGGKKTSQDFRVAQVDQGKGSGVAAVGNMTNSTENSNGQSAGLAEIVVTAQKRSEKLMDVPESISVLTGQRLETLGANSLSDIAGYVPGLSITSGGVPGANGIVIRGIATSYLNLTGPPTVATYVDDISVGSTTNGGQSGAFGLDLMPYDLERVEVLEGPQGTLYGADAMGGVVKYVLRKPSLSDFDARVGTNFEDVHGGGAGWSARGAVNMPLVTGAVGLLLSGYYQHNGGWIDNVGTGISDANHSKVYGGRASILWHPTDRLSIQASWLGQNINAADTATTLIDETTRQPIYGRDTTFTYFAQPVRQQTRLGSLDINWDVDFATVTSVSSWSHLVTDSIGDASVSFGPATPGHPDALSFDATGDWDSKFTQEVRLASPESQRIQWMIGGLYTKENFGQTQNAPTFTQTYVPLGPDYNLLIADVRGDYKEWAIFGNGTVKITNHIDVSGGVRYASNTQSGYVAESSGVYGTGAAPSTSRPYQGKVTWMANTRYHFDENAMVYARVATGYRPGGGCSSCGNPNLGTPNYFFPDTITNYEIGFKGQMFEQRLQVSAAVFYIDWKDIQLTQFSAEGVPYTGNGGTAVSKGIELTSSYSFSRNFRLSAMLDYNHAYLTEDVPAADGKDGDQLPASARWSGAVLADYERPLNGQMSLTLSGDYRYKGNVFNQFPSSPQPEPMGPQNIVNLSAGLTISGVSTRLYCKNVFDNVSYAGLQNSPFSEGSYAHPGAPFTPIQPRTIGLSADYHF